MKPLVSIVIPVYNVEEYIDRCLKSMVNQTYSNLDIILVDDGSPDNCPQICEDWAKKDSRIRVIHKQNEGHGIARNWGIDIAKGEYVTFFDSDDYVDLTIIEKCVNSALKHKSDVVIFGRKDVSVDGEIKYNGIATEEECFSGEVVVNEFLPGLFIYERGFGISACRLYKVATLKQYNLKFKSEREYISEDACFSLELFSKDIVVSTVPEGLYFYCDRPGSFSRIYSDDRQNRNNLFLQKNSEFAQSLGLSKNINNYLSVRYHFYTLRVLKQIISSDMNRKEKKKKLLEIYESKMFRETLKKEVLQLEKTVQKVFFYTIKFKCYFLSNLLLKIKVSKGS